MSAKDIVFLCRKSAFEGNGYEVYSMLLQVLNIDHDFRTGLFLGLANSITKTVDQLHPNAFCVDEIRAGRIKGDAVGFCLSFKPVTWQVEIQNLRVIGGKPLSIQA